MGEGKKEGRGEERTTNFQQELKWKEKLLQPIAKSHELSCQQHKWEQDCSSQQQPAKMSTQSNRGVAASEHVAQYVGCRSKADLRVSGPRSTSSCSFALVMWLTTQIHKQLYQYKRWSSKLQRWEQKEPPRVEKEFKQSSLLMPMHYAVIPLSFKFHRNLSWSDWQLPRFPLHHTEYSYPPSGLALKYLCQASNRHKSWCKRGHRSIESLVGQDRTAADTVDPQPQFVVSQNSLNSTISLQLRGESQEDGWHLRNNEVQDTQDLTEISRVQKLAARAMYLEQKW